MDKKEHSYDHLRMLSECAIRVRRSKGISTVSFAQMLNLPIWLIEVAEQPELLCEYSELIPRSKLEQLKQAIEQETLNAEEGDNLSNGDTEEVKVLLPITVSEQTITDLLQYLYKSSVSQDHACEDTLHWKLENICSINVFNRIVK